MCRTTSHSKWLEHERQVESARGFIPDQILIGKSKMTVPAIGKMIATPIKIRCARGLPKRINAAAKDRTSAKSTIRIVAVSVLVEHQRVSEAAR
jgi:hypothetical protein